MLRESEMYKVPKSDTKLRQQGQLWHRQICANDKTGPLVRLTDLSDMDQSTTGPDVALTVLGHMNHITTGPYVILTVSGQMNQITTGPVMALTDVCQ